MDDNSLYIIYRSCCYPTETVLSIAKQELENENVRKFGSAEDKIYTISITK